MNSIRIPKILIIHPVQNVREFSCENKPRRAGGELAESFLVARTRRDKITHKSLEHIQESQEFTVILFYLSDFTDNIIRDIFFH